MKPRAKELFSVAAAVAAAALIALGGTSHAEDGADELIRRGVEARKVGDNDGAMRLFRQAYEAGKTAHAAGQLGLCEHALGLWPDAEAHVIEALKQETDPWVRKNRPTLTHELEVIQSHLGRVEIGGEPVGAAVSVNGRDVGALPLPGPVRVAAGDVEIALSAPGFVTARKTVHVDVGQYQHVGLYAERNASPSPSATAVEPTGVVATPAAPTPHLWRPRYKWIGWGAGALALVVGVYGTAQNLHLVDVFNNAGCGIDDRGRAVSSTGVPDPTCAAKRSDYESASHVAIGGFVAAGLLVAAGTALWLTEPKAESTVTAWTSCRIAVTARLEPWLGCALRF